ncbi:Transmembrane protein, putative [Arachis hypogaea]|nr:Transmembrane protein, putative [Arachis hypogaea]
MKRKVLLVSCVVGFLGLLSAATSFGAEATRIKRSQVQFVTPNQCIYPRTPALPLGLTAALALMVSQIVINVAAGCICCRKFPQIPDSSWKVALISFSLSWFTFVIAFLLLLTAAALNDQHGEESIYFGCAILSLASVAFGIVYYITLAEGKNGNNSCDSLDPNHGGIAMGQPQIPPTQVSHDPVFVHEDTYIRRQFT